MISQEKCTSAGVATSGPELRVSARTSLHVWLLVLLHVLKEEAYLKHYPSNSALHSGGGFVSIM